MNFHPAIEVAKIRLTSIVEDTSIQCRSSINMATVNDYAEAMSEGTKFPPPDVYGTKDRVWIGDGWHRYMAAKQNQFRDIEVSLCPGDRTDALRHALKANSTNGLRRTNADKRRSVEIAVKEFADLSSRAIAGLCAVSHVFVEKMRSVDVVTVTTSKTVKGADGKQYPATKAVKDVCEDGEQALTAGVTGQANEGEVTVSDPSPAPVVTPKSTKVPTLRSCWMQASKAERERFLQWVEQDRTTNLPAGDIRDVWRLTAKLRRALRKSPFEKRYVARELGLAEIEQVTP